MLWVMFSVWMIAPSLELPREVARTSGALAIAEVGALLAWSFGTEGCAPSGCVALAHVAGDAARSDIPLLGALFLVVAVVRLWRPSPARA